MNDKKRIGKNIASLRKFYGETQVQLAEFLHLSSSAISEYERGNNEPDKEILQNIASHYRVPSDMLLFYDLSDIGKPTFELKGTKHALELMDIIFPLVSSPEALENESFRKGHQVCQEIKEKIRKKNIFPLQAKVDDCIDVLYDALFSFDNEPDDTVQIKIPEAAANIFWIKMTLGYLGIIDSAISADYRTIVQPNEGQSFYRRAMEIRDKERSRNGLRQRRRQLVEDEFWEMSFLLRILKHTSQWSDLGDYWLAIMYMYSIVADENAKSETNEYIGMQLMIQFAVSGNPYAQSYLRFRPETDGDFDEINIIFV